MSFKVGDKVIHVGRGTWYIQEGPRAGQIGDGPKHKEELVVDYITKSGFLGFDKYRGEDDDGYDPKEFRKLDDNFGAKVCEQIEKTFIKPLIPVEHE